MKKAAPRKYESIDPETVLDIVRLVAPLANLIADWPLAQAVELEQIARKIIRSLSAEETLERVQTYIAILRPRQKSMQLIDQLGAAVERLRFATALHRASAAFVMAYFVFITRSLSLDDDPEVAANQVTGERRLPEELK